MKNTLIRIPQFILLFALLFTACNKEDDPVLNGIEIGGAKTDLVLTMGQVDEITPDGARAKGEFFDLKNHNVIDYGHVWSIENLYPTVDDEKSSLGNLNKAKEFVSDLTGLMPNTTYFIRTYVTTDKGTGYSKTINTFKTTAGIDDVIVINEGNFLSADGSLSTYNTTTGEVKLGAFTSANGFPFAATIQNGVAYNGNYYFVTNSADKVEVLNQETLSSTATIKPTFSDPDALVNPYMIAAVGEKAYVSNWGKFNSSTFVFENSFVAVLDLTSNTITGKLDWAVKPQGMIAAAGKVFVADNGSNTISVIDPTDDQVSTTITVESGPDKMILDKNNKIWVICNSGNLVRINPGDNTVEATIPDIKIAGYNEKMVINSAGDMIYYLHAAPWPSKAKEIYAISIDASAAPSTPIISGENFYGLGISPANKIYVTDANGFLGNGTVVRYEADGTKIDEFECGRGPNGFLFR